MNLLKRAGLYTLRSRGRTLLLFAVLLLAATFVLSGLSAMEASENTSAKLRGTTGASFTVERNLSTGSMNSMGGGMSVIQQEFVTDAMLDEIRKVEGIKGYTAKEIGYSQMVMHAMLSVVSFYEKLGFRQEGDLFEERGINFVRMVKQL